MIVAAQLEMFDADEERFSFGGQRYLDYQTEHALLFGVGSTGNAVIREMVVWRREWAEWRDTLLPKFIAAFPGRRPAAAYIVGEVPLRPVLVELPLCHRYRTERCVYVIDGRDGFTYADLPEPHQPDEARHLYEAGVIDADEFRRYRGYSRTSGLRDYQWEVSR
jgi:hypothetical protein